MRKSESKRATHTSKCGDEIIRGTPQALVTKYEAKAYEARRNKDEVQAQIFFQHAEHWKHYGR